jgi:Fe-S-cluster containining protein
MIRTVLALVLAASSAAYVCNSVLQKASNSHASLRVITSPDTSSDILRKVDKWACISNCGACCKLGPVEDRPDLGEYLTEEEMTLYKSMIGPDNYCSHFDQTNKVCTIYDDRPSFCVVKPEKMKTMFGVDEEEINDFCAFCCREQITDVYGEESSVMERFEAVIASLRDDDDDDEGEEGERMERKEGEIDPFDGGKWISIDIDPYNPQPA